MIEEIPKLKLRIELDRENHILNDLSKRHDLICVKEIEFSIEIPDLQDHKAIKAHLISNSD
jgi:hypothetical protein